MIPNSNTDFKSSLNSMKVDIEDSIKEHNKYGGWDGSIYNVSTVLAISLSAIASIFTNELGELARIFTGITAIIIALDRSLNWGGEDGFTIDR